MYVSEFCLQYSKLLFNNIAYMSHVKQKSIFKTPWYDTFNAYA